MQTEARIAKFWTMVEVGMPEECWPWKGRLENGYGSFSFMGKSRRAHRASFLIENGSIPDGMWIDHMCRNRACVNPGHLRAVTPKTNSLENSDGPSAHNAVKTHCTAGHELIEGNLRVDKRGWRQCLTCHRGYGKTYRAKLRATSRSQHEASS